MSEIRNCNTCSEFCWFSEKNCKCILGMKVEDYMNGEVTPKETTPNNTCEHHKEYVEPHYAVYGKLSRLIESTDIYGVLQHV